MCPGGSALLTHALITQTASISLYIYIILVYIAGISVRFGHVTLDSFTFIPVTLHSVGLLFSFLRSDATLFPPFFHLDTSKLHVNSLKVFFSPVS